MVTMGSLSETIVLCPNVGGPQLEFSPIFIVGTGRSGTTLLSMMLNAHSQIAIGPETHYFQIQERCGRSLEDEQCALSFITNVCTKEYITAAKIDISELRSALKTLSDENKLTHKAIFETIVTEYAKNQNKQIWGEKTPYHLHFIPLIMQYFPNSKIVHLIRDPRDFSLSIRSVPWYQGNVLNHAITWRNNMVLAARYYRRYPTSLLEVRYEDLLADPEKTLIDVCNFLEVSFEPQMITAFNEHPNFDLHHEPWKGKALQPLDTTNSSKWVHSMSLSERIIIQSICRQWIKRHKYLMESNIWTQCSVTRLLKVAFSGMNVRDIFRWVRRLMST